MRISASLAACMARCCRLPLLRRLPHGLCFLMVCASVPPICKGATEVGLMG
jgi:hypothetical protein